MIEAVTPVSVVAQNGLVSGTLSVTVSPGSAKPDMSHESLVTVTAPSATLGVSKDSTTELEEEETAEAPKPRPRVAKPAQMSCSSALAAAASDCAQAAVRIELRP